MKLLKTKLLAENQLELHGVVEYQLIADLSCDCLCRVLPSDCDSATQRYDADTCQCTCRNVTSCVTWSAHIDQCGPPETFHCAGNMARLQTDRCL